MQESACGRHWRLATEEQRRAFCAAVRPVHMDEEFLLKALNTLLCGRWETLGALALADIVAMILAVDWEAWS